MKTNGLRWATKTFFLSISLSIVFSMISQSMFPSLPAFFSSVIIFVFIFISCLFDVIGVAFTSFDKEVLSKYQNETFYKTAEKLCNNTDKISSFCGDVVGDICGILSGAGGVSLVVNLGIANQSVNFLITCFVSSFIAGFTIFGKAVMKGYAINKSEKIVITTSKIMEKSVFNFFRKKKKKNMSKNA